MLALAERSRNMAENKKSQGTPQESKEDTNSSAAGANSSWGAGKNAHMVILKSGGGYSGIDINIVQEIVLMQEITLVPGSAKHVAGMTDLRGLVVPVTEFAILLGRDPTERTDDTRILVVEHASEHIGLVVDAVTEVMMVDGDKIEDATTVGSQKHEFIMAVAKLEEQLESLVDVNRLLVAANQEPLALAA